MLQYTFVKRLNVKSVNVTFIGTTHFLIASGNYAMVLRWCCSYRLLVSDNLFFFK